MINNNKEEQNIHQLEINLRFEHDDVNLEPNEIIRNIITPYKIIIKNVGDIDFPGGVIEQCFIKFEGSRQALERFKKCPSITINSEHIVHEDLLLVTNEGLGWLYIYLTSADKIKIKYYQSYPSASLDRDHWVNSLYVVNKEMYILLKKIEEMQSILSIISKDRD